MDIEGFGKLIEFQALNGTSAVLIMGSPGDLRKPYLNMTGQALRRGVEGVRRLGLAEQYGYRVREDLIGADAPGEPVGTSVPTPAATGSGACFMR